MRILVAEAHPDELEHHIGGSIAKMSSEGKEVYLVTLTSGEVGTLRSGIKREDLKATNEVNQMKSSAILGIKETFFLGYRDGELVGIPMLEMVEEIRKIVAEVRPNLLITLDPLHPLHFHHDHPVTGWAAKQAASFAGWPLVNPQRISGEPYYHPSEIYYFLTTCPNLWVEVPLKFMRKKFEALTELKTSMDLQGQAIALSRGESIDPEKDYSKLGIEHIENERAMIEELVDQGNCYFEAFRTATVMRTRTSSPSCYVLPKNEVGGLMRPEPIYRVIQQKPS